MKRFMLCSLFFVSGALFTFFVSKNFFCQHKNRGCFTMIDVISEKKGTLIFLNGPSSSGKTSIVRALQDLFQEPYLRVSIDGFLATMPRRFWGPDAKQANLGFEWVQSQDEQGPLTLVTVGPWGAKLIAGMYSALANLVEAGNNVVMDDVMLRKQSLFQAVHALKNLKVYFVGVKAPLPVLEERERARGDRALSMARGQHRLVHAIVYEYGAYDFEIDTSLHTPEACAQLIKKYIDEHQWPQAFAKLGKNLR